ncbi:SusC/RagA family TonB-linked outer membrane protein [Mangrovivirga sp. M17]|uniref:SusC/RagA family TonB-linked outer membrane protein n=1 Tax=Mangrovivirga halotolerans TaxID=2993936 RepID=A0ABT3RLR9_9BACT|nr:SusC/RagA family TonB-linked outer membrane protein [Mangrovivirga halotolerans]MCX2742754.1 SusC/RagA family TonB-linked outer membrane protein [Mangrovivirga halotolerans]
MLKIYLMAFCLISFIAIGQDKDVTGYVTGEGGDGIPGVNVLIKGTSSGVVTDIEGRYTINVPSSESILVFSSIGYVTQEIPVGSKSTIDVVLREDIQELSEVVVTAMNISREKASLGYSQQTLDSDAVSKVKETNFINSLSGKAAGVNVRQNNTMGGSTNILIRGNSSFTNNQPLFVVDGTPINNATENEEGQINGRNGYDYGNPAADINPEDIESMSILKGAAATALYGSRGQNGVILITTKKGADRKGIGISVSSGFTIGTIDKSTFAEYQKQYGAGYGAYYGSTGYFNDLDVDGDGVDDLAVPTTEDASFGGAFDPSLNVYHWDAFVPESDNYLTSRPWVAGANDPVEFFETQTIWDNTIALFGGNENLTYRVSYTNVSQNGILPNSEMTKNTINFNGSAKLNDKLTTDIFFQYNRNDVVGRYSTGYSDNLMSQYRQWWQTNVDIRAQEDIFFQTGKNYTWNAADPTSDPTRPIYWDNPYWTRYKNFNSDLRDRFIMKVGLNYQIVDWLSLNLRFSGDMYNWLREERRAVGSVPAEFTVNRLEVSSGYQKYTIDSEEFNYNAILNANKQINEDLSIAGLLGFNLRRENYDFIWESTSGGLAVPDLYSLSNSLFPNPFPDERLWQREVYGYFGNVNIGWQNTFYLDGNYRIDVTSTLPVENNQYDYWSVGIGYVFSEMFDIDWMDFGKFRASYGTVGNDTRPLRVKQTYERINNFGGAVLTSLPDEKNNDQLKPELTKEWEVGLALTLFRQRLNFDLAYYDRTTDNQLMAVKISQATGYDGIFINAGEIENKGIELMIGGDWIKNADWRFNTTVNFTRNRSEVKSLIGDVQTYVFASYQSGVTSNAQVGQPFGVLKGTGYQYINGQRVINSDGYPVAVTDQIIGDPNPDWTMGINNTFSYKALALSFLIDIQKGGDIYSLDMHYGRGTGLYPETAGLNDRGNPIRTPVADGGGFLYEGVTEAGEPNTTYGEALAYNGAFYWGNDDYNPNIMTVYDAGFVRLRELSLSYTFPKSMFDNVLQRLSLSFVGRNLWIIDKDLPYADPESGLGAGVSQGFITGAYPTVKTFGFKVDATF